MKPNTPFAAHTADLFHWFDGTDLIVDMHDRDQKSPGSDDAFKHLKVDQSFLVNIEESD